MFQALHNFEEAPASQELEDILEEVPENTEKASIIRNVCRKINAANVAYNLAVADSDVSAKILLGRIKTFKDANKIWPQEASQVIYDMGRMPGANVSYSMMEALI